MRIRSIHLIVLCAIVTACDSGTEPDPTPQVARVVVEPQSFVLEVGETLAFSATPQDAGGQALTGHAITWVTSDDGVATVSPGGVVTSVGEGPVTVSASADGHSGTATGHVEPNTTVTAAGGTLVSGDGRVTLVFPPGAVSEPVKIGIQPSSGLPDEPRLVSGSAYRFGPAGLHFAVPVQLTLDFGELPSELADGAPYLWLHRYTDDSWVPVPGAVVDLEAGVISAPLTGFSDYAAVISELAAQVYELNATLNRLLSTPIAQDAVTLMSQVAGLLAQADHPLYDALIEPVIDAMIATSCSARTTAVTAAQSAAITTYEAIAVQLRPVYYWTAVLIQLAADDHCPPPISSDALHTQKLNEFVEFFVARLSQPDFTTDFEKLIAEVRLLTILRGEADLLDLADTDGRLLAGAQLPLLHKLRESGYVACRNDAVHKHLGLLRGQILTLDDVPYSEDDLLRDLQFCGTRLGWTVTDGDAEVIGTGDLGGGASPGMVTLEATSPGAATGTLALSGDVRAFRCADGSFAGDELIIALAGTEIRRTAAAADGNFFASPIEFDLEAVLATADIDPNAPGTPRLDVARTTTACAGQYVQSLTDPITLAAIDLTYPADWSYENDFSATVGPEWSSSSRTTAPSGEAFLGIFDRHALSVSLDGLPGHSSIRIEFDLYVLGSMDGSRSGGPGPDVFAFLVDGVVQKRTTFSNVFRASDNSDLPSPQAYPGEYPQVTHPPATGASAVGSLGFESLAPDEYHGDTTYRVVLEVEHTDDALLFRIVTEGLQEYPNEGWGIDNVRVTTGAGGS